MSIGHGKWSQSGVPHTGWACVEIEDLGAPDEVCEMCESQPIRYVHYMEHPNYPDTLAVGCICAGHMEGDPAAATRRDADMKSRTGKRKRWLSRKWRTSQKGNPWLKNADGYRVTMYRDGSVWRATVASVVPGSTPIYIRRRFQTCDQAKLAAFDLITKLLARSP